MEGSSSAIDKRNNTEQQNHKDQMGFRLKNKNNLTWAEYESNLA